MFVCVYIYVYIYVCVCVCVYACVCMHMCVCTCICVYPCACVYIYIYIYIYIYRVYVYIYMCVCVCVCTRVCIYIYIYIRVSSNCPGDLGSILSQVIPKTQKNSTCLTLSIIKYGSRLSGACSSYYKGSLQAALHHGWSTNLPIYIHHHHHHHHYFMLLAWILLTLSQHLSLSSITSRRSCTSCVHTELL